MSLRSPGKPARSDLILFLACALSILAGAQAAMLLNRSLERATTRMTVEAFVPEGTRFGIYYNDRQQIDLLPVVANQWHSYTYKVPSVLTVLRFDPTEMPGVVTQIRSVRFTKGNGVTRQLDLSKVPAWSQYHMVATYDPSTGLLALKATGADQFVVSAIDVNLGSSALERFAVNSVSLLWAALLAGGIYFLLQTWEAGWRTALLCVPLAAGAIFSPRAALWAVPLLHLKPVPPDDAVGNPTYMFISKPEAIATAAVGIALSIAVVWAGILLERRIRRGPRWRLEECSVRFGRRDLGFVAGLIVVFAVLSLPEFQTIIDYLRHAVHPFGFDPQMATMWHQMAHSGLLPDRDFWYPYSGLYNKLSPFYPETLFNYLHNTAIFSVIAAGTYVLFGKRKLATAIVVLPLLPLLETAGVAWPEASWRYLLGVSILVSLGAAFSTRRLPWFVLSGASSAYVLSQESAQFVYAIPAAMFMAVTVLALERHRPARFRLLRLLGSGLLAFAVCTAGWLTMMLLDRRLAGWWAYMSELDIQAHYFAYPFNIGAWFHQPYSVETFGYLILIVLFVAASLQIFRCRNGVPPSHIVPFALAILAAMILQKDILRPGMISQFIAILLLGLMMVLVQYAPPAPERQGTLLPRAVRLGWTGFASSFLFVLFFVLTGQWADVQARYTARLRNLGGNLPYAWNHKAEWAGAAADYLAPGTFLMGDARGDVMKAEYLRAVGAKPGKIFALGDCAYWYLILGQQPPFYSMFFHQAPLDSQENTVHWLARNQPRYVIWDPTLPGVDGVPSDVRVPLLYTYIAANYVPDTRVRNFLVLRRRISGEPASLSFWTQTLTSKVDLGFIPALSRLRKKASYASGIPVSYLLVHVDQPSTGRPHDVPLTLGANQLTVSFREQSSVKDYPIRIDRLAVVAAAAANGIRPEVKGPNATFEHGFLRHDLLY